MSAKIIDGRAIATKLKEDIAKQTAELKDKGITPTLAVVLLGDDPASLSYIKGKKKALEEIGMGDKTYCLDENTSQEELLDFIHKLNHDKSINGILLQLPFPKQIQTDAIIAAIDPAKDVDGFHPMSAGKLFFEHNTFVPCTANGIIQLIKLLGIETSGKHAVVIGRSNIVGKPVALLLFSRELNCTVTVCHSRTTNLSEITRQADILIAAIGKAQFIKGDMIKKGAIVIDVGVNRIPDSSKKSGSRLVGDVDFEAAFEVASMITPVPGGAGPMTIAMLMQNILMAARQQNNIE